MVLARACGVGSFSDEGGGMMLTMSEIRLDKQVGRAAISDLETELDEVIKSLEEAAQEIEKLAWEKEEGKPSN
jgi:hypothetical protein